MANLSEVSGVLKHSGKDIERLGYKKIVLFLHELYSEMDSWTYNFSPIHYIDLTNDELEKLTEEELKKYIADWEYYGTFMATGRWSFESIVSSFSENIDLRRIYRKHKIRDFEFHIVYDEFEPGCVFLCVGNEVKIHVRYDESKILPDKEETYLKKSQYTIIIVEEDGTPKERKLSTDVIAFNDGYIIDISYLKNYTSDISRENINRLKFLTPDGEYDFIYEYMNDIDDFSHDQIDYFMTENGALLDNFPEFKWDAEKKKLFKNNEEYVTKQEQKIRNGVMKND